MYSIFLLEITSLSANVPFSVSDSIGGSFSSVQLSSPATVLSILFYPMQEVKKKKNLRHQIKFVCVDFIVNILI